MTVVSWLEPPMMSKALRVECAALRVLTLAESYERACSVELSALSDPWEDLCCERIRFEMACVSLVRRIAEWCGP